MTLFSRPIAKRRAAWMVLCVWLFALASGVANACLLQERTSRTHDDRVHASDLPGTRTISATHVDVSPGHDGTAQRSRAPCLKVCDQGAHSPVKHPIHPDTDSPPGLVGTVARVLAPSAVQPMATIPDIRRSAVPSIRVRYVRLAL